MRVVSFPFQTYSKTLTSSVQVQPSQVVPNLGPLQGIYCVLTVALTGATASQASNSIDNSISVIQVQDQYGKLVLNLIGTDLTILNDILQPRGVRTAPPTITTNSAGAGSASWSFFLPATLSAKDMPGQINLTLAAESSLQNASLTSAGTATFTLNLRGAYSTQTDQPTVRVNAVNIPHAVGDNSAQAYLPNGEQVEALTFVTAADYTGSTGTDTHLNYVTLIVGGALFLNQAGPQDFIQQDNMLMQSGHAGGEYICRVPVFVVDSTVVMDINLATDTAVRLYTLSTVPQKRS